MNILVTGGPVHAYLDDVKIITNRFKGGLMADLASELSQSASVTYLTCNLAKIPKQNPRLRVVLHDGFDDFQEKILKLAPEMDAVVHGAAVANLIPWEPIKGKFPSHNYKPGDPISITMKIAPRIIDMIKGAAPNIHLFGFKLLSGADHEELIQAAYGVLRESRATAIFANDAENLQKKYAVTKERGVHPMHIESMPQWILEMIGDEYYRSIQTAKEPLKNDLMKLKAMVDANRDHFTRTEDGYVFGTVAVRCDRGFLTTVRGKRELDGEAWVKEVDHESRVVRTALSKATLNAPLLDNIFKRVPRAVSILHYHKQYEGLPSLPYAPPGTVRDSDRDIKGSFNIEDHGCFILFDEDCGIIR